MSLKTIFDLTLSALTPLHIGSGETLEKEYDYAVYDKRTWVLNQDLIIERFFFDDQGRYLQELERTPPAQLLRRDDFQPDSPLFRYVLAGTPRATSTGAAVQSQIKTVRDEPYLPGSSIKGALRTIIFREAFAAAGRPLTPAWLNQNRSWAAQKVERDLLGKDPNHDLLRALHVSDSQPLPAQGNLVVFNAQVFSQSSAGSPIALECLRGDVAFQAVLTIDDYLFQDEQAQKRLRFTPRQETWLRDLATHANRQAQKRIQQEMVFYQARANEGAAAFYRQLAGLSRQMPADTFLLQVGWGGGWDSKTLAYLLPAAEKEAIIQNYRLAKGERRPGQPFPKSRRAIARGPVHNAQAVAPLGWLLVQMKARH